MFALTFPTSSWIHCVFVLNSLVNIYQEHFYISGHGSQLSCCEEQESHSSTWGGDTETEPSWFVWPRTGACWQERDGKATPRLQGSSLHSPPGLVTFCQSLCWVFIDPKNQAGTSVFLAAPQSRIFTSLGEKSCLSSPEMSSVPWHITLMKGPLHFPDLIADPWKASYRCFGILCGTQPAGLAAAKKPCPDFVFCATTLKCANWNGCNGTLFDPFQRDSLE